MLHSLNKFLHQKHVSARGSLGIYCDLHSVSAVWLKRASNRFSIELVSELAVTSKSELPSAVVSTLDQVRFDSVPVIISLAPTLATYDVLAIKSIPEKPKDREHFIKWRFEKQFHRKLTGDFRYSVLGIYYGHTLIAISTGSAALASTVDSINRSKANIQKIVPLPELIPILLQAELPHIGTAKTVVYVNRSFWSIVHLIDHDVIFCRQHLWETPTAKLFTLLTQEAVNTSKHFSSLTGHACEQPIFIIDDDVHHDPTITSILDQTLSASYCTSKEIIGHLEWCGESQISLGALAAAFKGFTPCD